MIDLTTTPSFRLDGKRALVTGAGRGIGLAAAAALAEAGAHVTLAARTTTEIEEAADAIRARGQKAEALTLDVTDLAAMQAAIAQGRAVRHPGQQCRHQPAEAVRSTSRVEDFDVIMGLNVRAAYFVAQAVARAADRGRSSRARSSTSRRRWAMSAPRGARSTAPPSTPWKASPRRWRSSSRRTTSASIRSARRSSRRR